MKITIKRVQVSNCRPAEHGNSGRNVVHCRGECGQRETSHAAGWQITVMAYHQFGSCRSPEDWKWKALAPRGGEDFCTLQRDMAMYPSGAMMRKWQESN